MSAISSAAWGFVDGAIAWAVAAFFAQPLTAFLEARTRAAEALARFDRYESFDPESEITDEALIALRRASYEECGSRLVAFDLTNQFLSRCMRYVKLTHPLIQAGPKVCVKTLF